ncbi:MAG TPA: tetratricopeptide repeat protein [Acidobacteriota bacterium]|nr:tetratricopeptide repeat protein [Acidobacteriota bacterium]
MQAYWEGLDYFQQAIASQDPSQARRLFSRALEFFRRGAAESHPFDLAVYYTGLTLARLGRLEEAIPYLRQTIRDFEEAPVRRLGLSRAYADLGTALCLSGRGAEALETFALARSGDRDSALLHLQGGICHYRLKRFDDAVAYLERAAQLDSEIRLRARYHIGLAYLGLEREEEALQTFRTVVSEAPESETAVRARGLIASLEGLGSGAAPKAGKLWQLRFSAGTQYDSNVLLQPEESPVFRRPTDEADVRLVVTAGGGLELWNGEAGYLRAQYDFLYTRHSDLEDFNLQSHRPRLQAAWRAGRGFRLGVEGGAPFYRLGGQDYLRQIYLKPFAAFFLGSSGYVEAFYQYTDQDFRIDFFDPQRDGRSQEAGGRYFWLLDGFQRHLYFGYKYIEDNPERVSGNDFQYSGHQFELGCRFPLAGRSSLDIGYAFRHQDYPFPINLDPLGRIRQDDSHQIQFTFRRPLNDYLRLQADYLGQFNNSTIEAFEYRRNIASIAIHFDF